MCRQRPPDLGCVGSVRRTAAAVMTYLACLSLCIPALDTAGRHDTGACGEGTVNLASRAAGGRVWALREQARDDLVAAAAIDGNISAGNGWAFDGFVPDAVVVFFLGGHRAVGGPVEEVPWMEELVIYTAVGLGDHHATSLRLWWAPRAPHSRLPGAAHLLTLL